MKGSKNSTEPIILLTELKPTDYFRFDETTVEATEVFELLETLQDEKAVSEKDVTSTAFLEVLRKRDYLRKVCPVTEIVYEVIDLPEFTRFAEELIDLWCKYDTERKNKK